MPRNKLSILKTFLRKKWEWIGRKLDEKEAVDSSDDEQFVECVSDMEIVDQEENIPKANYRDEKHFKRRKPITSSAHDQGKSGKVLRNDSGILDLSEIVGTDGEKVGKMIVEDSNPILKHDNIESPPVLASYLSGNAAENTPEKFRRFLHERSEEVERMGISIVDSEGYLDENDESSVSIGEEEEKTDSYSQTNDLINERSLAVMLNDTLWEKLVLLV